LQGKRLHITQCRTYCLNIYTIKHISINYFIHVFIFNCEGWNFNSGNY